MRRPAHYTQKQKTQVQHLVEQFQRSGFEDDEAQRRASNTVGDIVDQKVGGLSGRGRKLNKAPEKFGGTVATPISKRREQAKANPKTPTKSSTKAAEIRAMRRQRIAQEKPASATEQSSLREARQIICQQLARISAHGYDRIRVRSHRHDSRVQFQGRKKQRWETIPDGEFREQEADAIVQALEQVREERHRVLDWRTRQKTKEKTFEVGLPPSTVPQQPEERTRFFAEQLFHPAAKPRAGFRGKRE